MQQTNGVSHSHLWGHITHTVFLYTLWNSWSFIKFPCYLGLESSHLWLVMKEEKMDQEKRRRGPARWNKARTCLLVWSVIYLNLLWDSRTGCVCVYVGVCTVSMYSLLIWCYCECVCVCEEWWWNTPPLSIHQTEAVFFVWGDTRPTWIYLQRNLYELWWTCLDQQLQAAQQRASIKTLLNCINKCGEAKGDRQCRPSP